MFSFSGSDAPHKAYFHNTLLVSHPIGLQSDASHHLKNLRKEDSLEHSTFTFSYQSGGGMEESHVTDNDCVRYVEENFWFGKSEKINVVVPHLEQLDQKSLNHQMASCICEMFSTNNNFLFTEVNLFHLLRHIGYNENELDKKFNCQLQNLPNLLVLYPDGYSAVILITLPETRHDSIHDLILKSNANIKAYLLLHRHRLIVKEKFMVINVVGAIYHEKSSLKLSSYCGSCNADLFITKEDLNSKLHSWFLRLQKLMKKLSNERKIEYDVKSTHETASMLAILNCVTDDRFPTLFASEDERINKIVLNEKQRSILLNPAQRKIIVGK